VAVRTDPPTRRTSGRLALSVDARALPQEGRLRSLVDFYVTTARTAVAIQLQYRVAQYFYMLGMVAEPVIYLVVWSSIARSSGGAVNGITAGQLAAYYIVWTLVRNMNVVFGAPFWEWRIREGELSGQLLRPLHPIHYDLAYFAGWKVVVVALWVPIAVALSLIFHPDLHPSALQVVVFLVAIWGAYLVRSMYQSTIGMLNFWTTRGAAVFDLYMTLELLLSGRLVPLRLMPGWVQTLANFLPFKWTFGFPIESLAGDLSTRSLLVGLGAQALWFGIGIALFNLAWRAAIKRFSAVGG
jgi:viologen exporter family transport system permease protein